MHARSIGFVLIVLLCQGHAGAEPAAPQASVDRLETLVLRSSFRDAGKLADDILAGPASDARARAVCGLALLKAGRVREAEKTLKEAVAASPGCPEAHLGLGRLARIRNDRDAAIAHFRQALPSKTFYEDALRQLWRAVWDRGEVSDLFEIYKTAEERYAGESKPLPSWFTNGLAQVRGLDGKRLFEMAGRFERVRVPMVTDGPQSRTRMIAFKLNGKGEYLFHIDSALPDFMSISPLLAEELGLVPTGSATSIGVGTASVATRFSVLDEVRLGPLTFRNVPVMVSDVRTLRGVKEGLVGTAWLKRFNMTIDVDSGFMDLFPLDRPELLAKGIDRARVAADVPLLLFDATMVEASLAGAPPALYILDSAASTNLVDGPFFEEHIKPKIDPSRIVRGGIRGAGGAQTVNRIDGLSVALGSLVFEGQTAHEFPMGELNMIGGRYAAGLLGNPLLWPYRVHMDFRAGRLILENRATPAR
jgi:hypothetical protein